MKILVIGNGFDLQHNLPTRYSDFLDYCDEYSEYVMAESLQKRRKDLDEKYGFGILEEKYSDIYDESRNLVSSFWIQYFQNRRKELGHNWIDFETEIEHVVKRIYAQNLGNTDNSEQKRYVLPAELQCYAWRTYFDEDNCFEYLRGELEKLTRLLEIYLDAYVNEQISRDRGLEIFSNLKPDKLLSFNYTDTYYYIYGGDKVEYDYIHGHARKDYNHDCNLVIGYDDHYLGEDVVSELIPFEKYYQRIVLRTGATYSDWLVEKDELGFEKNKEVYFYGHSMSPADGDVIKRLICSDKTKTTIFYRKNHERERAEMIKNLAIVLTPEELIKRTGGKDASLVFVAV